MLQKLENTSEDFRNILLLKFTKELIKNSVPALKHQIEEKENQRFQEIPAPKIAPILPQKPKTIAQIRTKYKPLPKSFKLLEMPERLKIPQPRLPQHLRGIKPTRMPTQIDLGKLNPLINSPLIKTIECNGPNQRIIIRDPSQKQTKIILTKEEIDNIIKKFVETAKIPMVQEGIFRVAVGKLVLSAIISKVVPIKFIIKKIRAPIPPRTNYLRTPIRTRMPIQRQIPRQEQIFPRKII